MSCLFLQCLFFVCLLFVRAFDCLLCVALTLFLLCFVSAFFASYIWLLSLAPPFPLSTLLAVIVGLQFVWPKSPTSQAPFSPHCQNCYCFVVGLALLFPFFLGRKFMLTVLHWKCINLCVYTMCRHSLSRPEGQSWVGEESHMCLLSTFYGLCPCPCSWLDTPYSSIVRSRHVLFTYSLSVFI